jgi:hypothetical protein
VLHDVALDELQQHVGHVLPLGGGHLFLCTHMLITFERPLCQAGRTTSMNSTTRRVSNLPIGNQRRSAPI